MALSFVTVAGHSLGSLKLPQGRTATGLQPHGLENGLTALSHSCPSLGGTSDFILFASHYLVQSLTQKLSGMQLVPFSSTLRVTANYLILYQVAGTSEGESYHHYHQQVRHLSTAEGL